MMATIMEALYGIENGIDIALTATLVRRRPWPWLSIPDFDSCIVYDRAIDRFHRNIADERGAFTVLLERNCKLD